MIECSFELNNKPMSVFKCGPYSVPAFSGYESHANKKFYSCVPDLRPIPPGRYHIIDRESGGFLGPIRDYYSSRDGWFSLYAIDDNVDDEMYCERVKRGNFRLHPQGSIGSSKGCITLKSACDFKLVRALLKSTEKKIITGKNLYSYGTVLVK